MSKGDMFLAVVGQRTGAIKGESNDTSHAEEIEVVNWSWGIKAHAEMTGVGSAGRATIKELVVVKHVDKASTALMSLVTTNEIVKKAVLTVRKAGTTQQEFFKLTIEKGRITSYDVQAPEAEDKPEILESLTFAFQKIEVEYRAQDSDGQLRGSGMFMHEIS
jgi:type VI secretion system secreted protein Hcp